MKTPKLGRNLTVLIVDDQPSSLLVGEDDAAFTHLDLRFIESWAEAQQRCATDGDLGGADILLIDVSFDTDPSIKKVTERGVSFLPVGPLLALPYIGKRAVMSCATYSAHMNNQALQKHPYFLLAMGLILARSVGIPVHATALHSKHLSDGEDRLQLDMEVERLARSGFTQPLVALVKGLEEYRESLRLAISQGNVTLVNHHSLLLDLSRLRATIGSTEESISLGLLQLRLVGRNWRDTINVQSLFSDRLNKLGKWATEELLNEIDEWVRDLGARSPAEWALKVVDLQEETLGKGQPRPDVKKTILECVGSEALSDEITEILRLCVLFANIWALEHPSHNGQVTRESVLSRLGENVDVNTYFGWFGERKAGVIPRSAERATRLKRAKPNTGAFKQLRSLSPGVDKFGRCFLSYNSSEISQDDYQAILKYRAYEEFPEWRVPPFSVLRS